MSSKEVPIYPSTIKDWMKQANQAHSRDLLDYSTLHEVVESSATTLNFGSGSKINYENSLLLRVLWKTNTEHPKHQVIFGNSDREKDSAKVNKKQPWFTLLEKFYENADPLLWQHLAAWKLSAVEINYRLLAVQGISAKQNPFIDEDPFGFVINASEQSDARKLSPSGASNTSQSPNSSSSSSARSDQLARSSGSGGSLRQGSNSPANPKREALGRLINRYRPDEALINMSLVSLLQGLWMPVTDSSKSLKDRYNWSIVHKQFSIPSRLRNETILNAKTDGCFRAPYKSHPDDGAVLAIIEVKPFRRMFSNSMGLAIQTQEGAEMAAWIATESKRGLLPSKEGRYRRLLVSQDFDQIYVIIAEYDDEYIEYIKGTPPPRSIPKGRDDSPGQRGRTQSRDPRGPPAPATYPLRGVDQPGPPGPPGGRGMPVPGPGLGPRGSMPPATAGRASNAPVTPQRGVNQPGPPGPPRGRGMPVPGPRGSMPPATPGRASNAPATPPAPKAGLGPSGIPQAQPDEERGFLKMYQYAPFLLGDKKHMLALFDLLLSLMSHLARKDDSGRLALGGPKA
jgi:hypothetical protein